MTNATVYALAVALLHFVFLARAILRPRREPASRVAWALVILGAPLVGMIAYILLGETNVGRKRRLRESKALALFPPAGTTPGLGFSVPAAVVPEALDPLFDTGRAVNGFGPVGGNAARLLSDSNAAIDAIVADIDAAGDHVHISFYIWLGDSNGLKVADALVRASGRGVRCRVIADGLGSRLLIGSPHWTRMAQAGVKTVAALRIGNPLLRALNGRIDIRNHRKIVVIDNRITYCGSQNCADPEFRIKARFAPWVDVMMRFEGPVARQNQYLFASQWMASAAEDLTDYLRQPVAAEDAGVVAQVTGTGPTVPFSAMPAVFASLIYAARRELVVTTPYYVPNETLETALCACARRGVAVTLIVPARNDSRIVAAASRSYYQDLLEAGVRIFEYQGGLLHAKTMTMDGMVTLMGSANLDRRSFELNYENNVLFADPALTADMRQCQAGFQARSREITGAEVQRWPMPRRLYNNAIAMLSPLL